MLVEKNHLNNLKNLKNKYVLLEILENDGPLLSTEWSDDEKINIIKIIFKINKAILVGAEGSTLKALLSEDTNYN